MTANFNRAVGSSHPKLSHTLETQMKDTQELKQNPYPLILRHATQEKKRI